MNEMKQEDVKRALECCANSDCNTCPYYGDMNCVETHTGDVFALLREKDATLEMCAEVIKRQDKELAKKDAEIERLEKANKFHRKTISENVQNELEVTLKEIENAKAEAITEFAERLKANLIKPEYPWDCFYVTDEQIDKIAKEIKGERK